MEDSYTFGNVNTFKVITPLVDILLKSNNRNQRKYCTSLISEYRNKINKLDIIEDVEFKLFILELVKNNTINNLKESKVNLKVYSHMKNLIIGIYNEYKRNL